MMGVDRGNMLTPSVLISTDTEDGHAGKEGRKMRSPAGERQQAGCHGNIRSGTYSPKRPGEVGYGSPSAAQQPEGVWSDHTRPLLGGRCKTTLLSGPCGGGAWPGGGPRRAVLLGCWM